MFSFLVFIFLGCQSVRDRTAQAGATILKCCVSFIKIVYSCASLLETGLYRMAQMGRG